MFKPFNLTFIFTLLLVAAGFAGTAVAEEKKVKVVQTQFGKAVTPLASPSASADGPDKARVAGKSRQSITQTSNVDFWIFDSWITLHEDPDHDGYYSRFSVEVDADTVFAEAPVYAVIYLGDEETFESIHVSSVFTIYGEDSHDSIVFDSDLVSGFPPYDYDILIELYDADTEELVAMSDGYSDADLAFVSLESSTYEYYREETVVVVEQHGGGIYALSLCLLTGVVVARRFKR